MNRLVFLNMSNLQTAPLSPVRGCREFSILKWATQTRALDWECKERVPEGEQRQCTAPPRPSSPPRKDCAGLLEGDWEPCGWSG